MIFITIVISAALSCACTVLRKRRIKAKDLVVSFLISTALSALALFLIYNGTDGFFGISLGKTVVAVSAALTVEFIRLAVHFIKAKRFVVPVCAMLSLFLALYAELIVCNFRYFRSEDYEERTVTVSYYGGGLKKEEDESWSVAAESSATVEFRKLDCEIKSIYADIKAYDADGTEHSVRITVYADDEANKSVRKLQAVDVLDSIEASKYIKMSLSGKSTTFRLQFSTKGERINIGTVKINARDPYDVNAVRLFVIFLLSFVILLIRPKSPIYEIKMTNGLAVRAAAGIAAMLIFTAFFGVAAGNANFDGNTSEHHNQYAELADALIKKQLWLDREVPQELIDMENPYDRTEREKVMKAAGKSSAWDTAYYDGHYYVYFGVVPAVLVFVPYKLITGSDLYNARAVMFFMFFAVTGVFALIKAITDRYFDRSRVPLVTYLITATAAVVGGGFMYLSQIPDLYAVPITSGAAFALWGLYFWISAEKNGKMRWYFLLPGSLCMALVAGCRPQMLLYCLAALPLFIPAVFVRRTLFSKKSIGATAALVLPVCAVAVLLMLYNNARFGSPFDFGANYNLTTNDMTRRGFDVDRIGLGLFTYLFQLPKPISVFPYLRSADMDTHYMGTTTYETIFGGVLATTPILWSLPLLFRMRKRSSDRTPVLIAAALCAAVLGIIIVDTEGAGLLTRYFSDFRFILCIAAAVPLLFFSADKTTEEHGNALVLRGYTAFAIISVVIFEFLMMFMRGPMRFSSDPNTAFVTFEHYVEFWS